MGSVFVLGGEQTDFSRNWKKEGKDVVDLLVASVHAALERTQVDPADVEVAHVGNFAGELYSKQGHLGAFFLEADPRFLGIPTARHEAACASGSIALQAAAAEIEAGRYSLACVVGVEQMKTVSPKDGGEFLGTAAWYSREAEGVEFPFPKLFGRLGDVYRDRYGMRYEHLAALSRINYENARRNPLAQTRQWYVEKELDTSETETNPVIGGPVRLSDCSQITDGAAAVFLASEEYARRYAQTRGLSLEDLPRIKGWGQRTGSMLFEEKVRQSEGQPYVLPHVQQTVADALSRAEMADVFAVDGIETHDCFTTSEYMAIDHFGLTAPGESWKAIEEGVIAFGGKLPMNPSGGLIGGGHPVGATGVRMFVDAWKQVSGNAGDYQIEGARNFATLNLGGSGTTSICYIVGR
jgi:acetyl-CoA C-acetyltransferase